MSDQGFTLIEILLSVTLIALLAGFSVPVYQSFQVRHELNVTAGTVAQVWRRAGFLASASDGDANWGVYVGADSIILFRGDSFVERDMDFNEVFDRPAGLEVSGLEEVVFEKFTGRPITTGSLTLTDRMGTTRELVINQQGMVEY